MRLTTHRVTASAPGPLLHVKWMMRGTWGEVHVARVAKRGYYTACGKRLAGEIALVPDELVTCQHCLKHIGGA